MHQQQCKQFSQLGYCEGEFSNIQAVKALRNICQEFLDNQLGKEIALSEYHHYVQNEEQHRATHYDLTQVIRKSGLHESLFSDNLSLFQALVGNDIDLQFSPYLRISRPNVREDNIGFHRDTFYGNTAYEISCIVPLADFSEGACVHVMPQSQQIGPLEYDQQAHEEITKGSKQNQIGFLYSTKHIVDLQREKLYAPCLSFGEYLMFSLGMIHGQEVNSSSATRWSVDFRFKNSFAPLNKYLKQGYYRTFVRSPATQLAQEYYSYNPNELADFVALENNDDTSEAK